MDSLTSFTVDLSSSCICIHKLQTNAVSYSITLGAFCKLISDYTSMDDPSVSDQITKVQNVVCGLV